MFTTASDDCAHHLSLFVKVHLPSLCKCCNQQSDCLWGMLDFLANVGIPSLGIVNP